MDQVLTRAHERFAEQEHRLIRKYILSSVKPEEIYVASTVEEPQLEAYRNLGILPENIVPVKEHDFFSKYSGRKFDVVSLGFECIGVSATSTLDQIVSRQLSPRAIVGFNGYVFDKTMDIVADKAVAYYTKELEEKGLNCIVNVANHSDRTKSLPSELVANYTIVSNLLMGNLGDQGVPEFIKRCEKIHDYAPQIDQARRAIEGEITKIDDTGKSIQMMPEAVGIFMTSLMRKDIKKYIYSEGYDKEILPLVEAAVIYPHHPIAFELFSYSEPDEKPVVANFIVFDQKRHFLDKYIHLAQTMFTPDFPKGPFSSKKPVYYTDKMKFKKAIKDIKKKEEAYNKAIDIELKCVFVNMFDALDKSKKELWFPLTKEDRQVFTDKPNEPLLLGSNGSLEDKLLPAKSQKILEHTGIINEAIRTRMELFVKEDIAHMTPEQRADICKAIASSKWYESASIHFDNRDFYNFFDDLVLEIRRNPEIDSTKVSEMWGRIRSSL